ncbi:hypothetical protein W97_00907 [Coniosporium apollinis CBS 100218]|uniref:Peptidase M43 pregnancy-associated plasma-A domain-containing protein n=1 Tax=Coniosporium apollinis (strain CBS 100218) TaxID=1168221 RepID=R7YJ93_CONA1|nr:uncharacterized protein W97_00907 [Coniosporium apollinis CBS 100218]EON61691.1 hypothetical protein W97_00907 [Coniosporium apollinis CBS 100218]
MFKSLLLASLACLAAAVASQRYEHFDCGTGADAATKDFIKTIGTLNTNHAAGSPGARKRAAMLAARQSEITVPTIIHIVATEEKKGQISEDMAQAQLDALNSAYNPQNIKFALQNTTWTVNDAWAVGAGDDDAAMKKALRQGTYETLNLYFQTDLEGNILGKCTLPSSIGGGIVDPDVYVADGCNIQANTMPGGSVTGYDMGRTAVHETGHWMGLLHTFEGYACNGEGDFITDTPAQSESTDGCPEVKNSCPDMEGTDAIHNFMDYSTDACYEGFSKGQQERMMTMWTMYRAGR